MIRKSVSQSGGGLPTEVICCSRCVISNQRPIFGVEVLHGLADGKRPARVVNGICNACRWTKQKEEIDWGERERQLAALYDRHRKSDGNVDVIFPASGGKDSRYVAHLFKDKYRKCTT